MSYIERPNVIKVFASNSMDGDYLPVKFGTNIIVAKDEYEKIANDNFEYGIESLGAEFQLKDLNSVEFYNSSLLGYLFQQGVPEYSPFQNYREGSVATYEGQVWVAAKDIKASVSYPRNTTYTDACGNPIEGIDPCNPLCGDAEYPSKETGWCALVDHCEYDETIKDLKAQDKAIINSIEDLQESLAKLSEENSEAIKSIEENSEAIESLEEDVATLLEQSNKDIINIVAGADGKVTYVLRDGTTKTLQIDTDQVVSVSANGQAITFTNEDGSTFTVTGTMIKALIASEYVDTTELKTALDAIDLDQVTKFSVSGSNLVITNEDGSTASISRDALVNFLNQGLVTDEELANAIANIKPVKVAAGNNTTVTSSTTNGTTTYTVNSLGYELDTSGQKLRLVNSNGKVVSTVSHTELKEALGVTEVFDVTGKTRFAVLEV